METTCNIWGPFDLVLPGLPIPPTHLRFTLAKAPDFTIGGPQHPSVWQLDNGQGWQAAALCCTLHPSSFAVGLSGLSSQIGIHSEEGNWCGLDKCSNQ